MLGQGIAIFVSQGQEHRSNDKGLRKPGNHKLANHLLKEQITDEGTQPNAEDIVLQHCRI